jgi:hypothetical protein
MPDFVNLTNSARTQLAQHFVIANGLARRQWHVTRSAKGIMGNAIWSFPTIV